MARSLSSPEIEQLIQMLAKLPGFGPRSARRATLELLKKRETLMEPLAGALARAAESVKVCGTCGNLDVSDPCGICMDPGRDRKVICVVEDVSDLWALERAGSYGGLYHVLGGILSAIDDVGPEDINIPSLVERAGDKGVTEVILATSATIDGQTTAHYIAVRLRQSGAAVTRLAHGVPVGGELDYLDDGTLSEAMKARRPVS